MTVQNVPKFQPNEKQMECIKTLNGPVMVLAGPGTGKTFTIIQRIKYMIEQNIQPASILCLTYSEAAANEMKTRIVSEIGAVGAAVTVNTYHAFCNEIIKQYPNQFELMDGVNLIDDITKQSLMSEVLEELKPVAYRTKWGNYYYFIPEHLKSIDEIKSNMVTKDEYFNVLNTHPQWQGKLNDLTVEYQEREQNGKLVKTFLSSFESHKLKMAKASELWDIYEAYERKMKENNYIDFNDMISLVLQAFETNEELLSKVASQYKYFLVDEYQDTNYSQNNIVFYLAQGSKTDNIFVVGDDDQIIYEFQGAKRDTLKKFLLKFPQTKVICLKENNRSCQNILDFSYDVISQDATRLEFDSNFSQFNIDKKLIAKRKEMLEKNNKIQVHSFGELKQENNFIVEEIEKIINSDNCPKNKDTNEKDLSQIAILARENAQLTEFAKLLEAKNIQYQIKVSKSIFEINSSILLYFYLKALLNNELYADKLYGLLLSQPFAFELADYNFLLQKNRENHKDFISNIREFLDVNEWKNKEKIKKFITEFDYLKKCMTATNIRDLIIEVLNRTDILNYYINCEINRSENISAINRIVEEAQSLFFKNYTTSLYDFLKHIDFAFTNDIPLLIKKDEYTQNAVQLITLHSSKGREFDFVFMPNLIARKWEGKRVSSVMSLPIVKDSDDIDVDLAVKSEQLRLLFVGITRAKHSLYMSFSTSIDGNPQELTSHLAEAIKNIDIVDTINHSINDELYENEIIKSLKKCDFDYKTAFKDEINARLKQFVMSPTALNSYLNCPRQFLYSQVLSIPVFDDDASNAHYGSAIHKTLEMAVKYAKENKRYPTIDEFLLFFDKNLSEQKFNTQEIRLELKNRGEKSLRNYYKHMIQTPYERIFATEYSLNLIPYGNNFLKGFVDRIEKNSDGTYEFYDYKTGGAKSKREISEGGKHEDYLNQLRFYKFAFEQLNKNNMVVRAGIIFVEEPEKNFIIDLVDIDNQIIENKIKSTYENISQMNFDSVEKSEKTCSFCKYKHLCNLNLF